MLAVSGLLTFALMALLMVGCSSESAETKVTLGQTIWETNCRVCHQQGLGGAPMIGNKKQWAPRIAQGLPVLLQHATEGYSGNTGMMPARGGHPELVDEQLRLAVEYMVSQSQ